MYGNNWYDYGTDWYGTKYYKHILVQNHSKPGLGTNRYDLVQIGRGMKRLDIFITV